MKEENLKHGALDRPEHWTAATFVKHEDIVGATGALPPANWTEKTPIGGFATYPIRDQGLQEDCVEYTLAKQKSVQILSTTGNYIEFSPHSVYPFVCSPGGGSNSLAASQYVLSNGMTVEALFSTDGLTEEQAESSTGYSSEAKFVAELCKPTNIVQCNADFETIASILQYSQSKGQKIVVAITIVGQNNGTWLSSIPQPPIAEVPGGSPNPFWYHRVSVTDFGLINGQKYLSIDNSWGTGVGNSGQQFLGENYAPSMYGGIYLV